MGVLVDTTAPDSNPVTASENLDSNDDQVAELAQILADEAIIPNAEELALVRRLFSPEALNAACKHLSVDRHAQIHQWVLELNKRQQQAQLQSPPSESLEAASQPSENSVKVGDRVFVTSCPHTDGLAPFEVLGIYGEYAKVELFQS
jgi:hypothetical protein